MSLKSVLLALPLALALPLMAQEAPPSVLFDAKSLSADSAELLAKAKEAPSGLGVKILVTRPDGNEQLVIRTKSGQGEWHHDYVDVMVFLEGEAQIITGGKVVNGKESGAGEVRGDGVSGGKTQTIHAGEMIRIEPQTAHQMLLAPGTTIKYFAVKIKVGQ
jgi:mannose-6-phosphate isomerase-like protein (cupin superfamily)